MTETKKRRGEALPYNLPPIGLSRETAAAFIDVSPSKFDEMVRDGRMPKPKQIDARRVWSRVSIEEAFARLPGDEEVSVTESDDEWTIFFDCTPNAPREPDITPWERKLLLALFRAGGRAYASELEGGGPASRKGLAGRGYLTQEEDILQLTDIGAKKATSMGAVSKYATVSTNRASRQNSEPRAPKASPPNANIDLDSDLIPYRFTVGHSEAKLRSRLGLLEMKVLRQLHALDGQHNNRYDILGAGLSTCGLLYARGYIEELGKAPRTWLAITEAGKAAYEAQR